MRRYRYTLLPYNDYRWAVAEHELGRPLDSVYVAICPIPMPPDAPAPLAWAMAVTGQPRDVWGIQERTPGWHTRLVTKRQIGAILDSEVTHIGVATPGALFWQPLVGEVEAALWIGEHRAGRLGKIAPGYVMPVLDALGLTEDGHRLLTGRTTLTHS